MSDSHSITDAKETLEIICEISKILKTGLDRDSLAICIRLIETGVNPEALAFAVRDLQEASQHSKAENNRDKSTSSSSTDSTRKTH